jgi:ABC-type Fe3+/spermidine/putrescine transport system ATPase subunit
VEAVTVRYGNRVMVAVLTRQTARAARGNASLLKTHKRGMGMVFQQYARFLHMTVLGMGGLLVLHRTGGDRVGRARAGWSLELGGGR